MLIFKFVKNKHYHKILSIVYLWDLNLIFSFVKLQIYIFWNKYKHIFELWSKINYLNTAANKWFFSLFNTLDQNSHRNERNENIILQLFLYKTNEVKCKAIKSSIIWNLYSVFKLKIKNRKFKIFLMEKLKLQFFECA